MRINNIESLNLNYCNFLITLDIIDCIRFIYSENNYYCLL